jgi:hypothetical protein
VMTTQKLVIKTPNQTVDKGRLWPKSSIPYPLAFLKALNTQLSVAVSGHVIS